jgi:hypothetical protein
MLRIFCTLPSAFSEQHVSRHMKRRSKRIVMIILLAIPVAGYIAFKNWETSWYVGLIPQSIEVDSVLAINEESAIREGCGAAIFRLSSEFNDDIKNRGLSALVDARQARSHDEKYFGYAAWQKTPYTITGDGLSIEDRWLNGLGCAKFDKDLSKRIYNALNSEGAYYSLGQESGLIVIPSLEIIVLSYEG